MGERLGRFCFCGRRQLRKGVQFHDRRWKRRIDYRITDSLAVGIFGSYAHTSTDLKPGDVDVNTGRGGLYATYWDKGFYINGAVYGGHNITIQAGSS